MPFWVRNCLTFKAVCAGTLSWCSHHPPPTTLPQVRAFSSHLVSQTLQDFQVKSLVNSLTRRNKFFVENSFHIKETNQHRLDIGLHLTRFFGLWWRWMLPVTWLLLCFHVITIAQAFVISDDLQKKVRINFQLFFQFMTSILSAMVKIDEKAWSTSKQMWTMELYVFPRWYQLAHWCLRVASSGI